MVALTDWVCFFWSGQLMFWPLVSLRYFVGSFVWAAFLFPGEWPMSPQFQRAYISTQWPITDQFFNTYTLVLSVWCRSSLVVYGMHRCASNHPVRLKEMSRHLWRPSVCGTHRTKCFGDGAGGKNGLDRLQYRFRQDQPSGDSLQALLCGSWRFSAVCSDTVSL